MNYGVRSNCACNRFDLHLLIFAANIFRLFLPLCGDYCFIVESAQAGSLFVIS
jgi:hypothetical protein